MKLRALKRRAAANSVRVALCRADTERMLDGLMRGVFVSRRLRRSLADLNQRFSAAGDIVVRLNPALCRSTPLPTTSAAWIDEGGDFIPLAKPRLTPGTTTS